jgi:hypothetical protein
MGFNEGLQERTRAALGNVRGITEIRMFGDCASPCTATWRGRHACMNLSEAEKGL